MLLAFAGVNVGLVVVQEGRTERALAALKQLTSPTALVIRDGARQRVPAAALVAGDLVALAEGDRVPADAELLAGSDLQADESLLTGESVPVGKHPGAAAGAQARPGGEGGPRLWSGSLIVRGSGLGRVVATGARTEIGRIGTSLGTVVTAPTALQIQTRRLVRLFATLGIGASVGLAVVYGLLRGAWVKGVLAGITLAMATLPEEFPLVLTVFLVLGAWRISQSKVLTRRASAIEALGAVTVLCTDKTGTLTVNRMRVAALVADGASWTPAAPDLPERFHPLVSLAMLASRPDPFDPMERAFFDLGARCLPPALVHRPGWVLRHGYPLQPALLAMSQLWQTADGAGFLVAAKGAPEAVADLCHLPEPARAALRRDVASLAAQGLRVLAVAEAVWPAAAMPEEAGPDEAGPDEAGPDEAGPDEAWPAAQHAFDFRLAGLVGLADPLRPEVPAAVRA
ncbi:MAG: ATPase, partial [Acidocella sp. 20-61-6]